MLESNLKISALDATIIVAYMIGIIFVGVWSSRRQGITTAGYFLAGRKLHWPMIGMALFATNITTVRLLSLTADSYRIGQHSIGASPECRPVPACGQICHRVTLPVYWPAP